ncbi:11296_t:CDS:2 [Entrophospora sp. SA101]|nr:11296_t:CDS:2 [Entrophospora sp. SA101]
MSSPTNDNNSYKTQEYWNERYSKEETFDWFKTYKDLSPLFKKHLLDENVSILMLGCGNSNMYDDGYCNITNVDFSNIVIDNMKEKNKHRSKMSWLVMDVRDLKMLKDDESFDVVIDKGTMDALMCDEGDVWNPKPEVIENVGKEVDQVVRRKYLERSVWNLEIETLGEEVTGEEVVVVEKCSGVVTVDSGVVANKVSAGDNKGLDEDLINIRLLLLMVFGEGEVVVTAGVINGEACCNIIAVAAAVDVCEDLGVEAAIESLSLLACLFLI